MAVPWRFAGASHIRHNIVRALGQGLYTYNTPTLTLPYGYLAWSLYKCPYYLIVRIRRQLESFAERIGYRCLYHLNRWHEMHVLAHLLYKLCVYRRIGTSDMFYVYCLPPLAKQMVNAFIHKRSQVIETCTSSTCTVAWDYYLYFNVIFISWALWKKENKWGSVLS